MIRLFLKSDLRKIITDLVTGNRLRYLLAGGWNTIFGYLCGLTLFYLFGDRLHVVVIGVVANVLAITMAFMTYKVFVFRTKGNWIVEYLRSYMVYGATSVLGIFLLWVLVDGAGIPFWVAQALAIAITVVVSYIGHSRFTFRVRA